MKRGLLPLLLLLGLLLACRSLYMDLNWTYGKRLFMDLNWNVGKSPTRWASISLCWGGGWSQFHCSNWFFLHLENAKVYGKGKFPYSEAAYYSSKLWHTQSEGKVVAHSAFQQSIIG